MVPCSRYVRRRVSIGVGHANVREGLLDVAGLAESGGAVMGLFYLLA